MKAMLHAGCRGNPAQGHDPDMHHFSFGDARLDHGKAAGCPLHPSCSRCATSIWCDRSWCGNIRQFNTLGSWHSLKAADFLASWRPINPGLPCI